MLADTAELTVAEFPQIAAHVEGFKPEIPAAPAQRRAIPPFTTGPPCSVRRAEVPQTVEVRAGGVQRLQRFPTPSTATGDVRPLEEIRRT